jgi:hypothetical protein
MFFPETRPSHAPDSPEVWLRSEKTDFLMAPLLERGIYGNFFTTSITAPDLRKAYRTNKKWDRNNRLFGKNGIAALTFCGVKV